MNRISRACVRMALSLQLLIVLAGPAWAYRPFDSTDADVAGPGEFELDLQPLGYRHEAGGSFLVTPQATLNLGFARGWELVLEGCHHVLLGDAGIGPRSRLTETGLSFKTMLREGSLQDKAGPSVATEFGLLLPTINDEPGVGGEWLLVVSQRWELLTLHANASLALTRAGHLGWFAGLILEGPYRWPLRPAVEATVAGEAGEPAAVSGLLGAIWRVREGLDLDTGVHLARDAYELRFGLTWAVPLWASP